MKRLKPFACSKVMVGGMESSCRETGTSTNAGPSYFSACASIGSTSSASFRFQPEQARTLCDFCEVRIAQVGGEVEDPGGLHLQFDKGERIVFEHDRSSPAIDVAPA